MEVDIRTGATPRISQRKPGVFHFTMNLIVWLIFFPFGYNSHVSHLSIAQVFAAVRERVKKNLDIHSAPEVRATPGQPWVRGWDDIKKGQDGPVSGNQQLDIQ